MPPALPLKVHISMAGPWACREEWPLGLFVSGASSKWVDTQGISPLACAHAHTQVTL